MDFANYKYMDSLFLDEFKAMDNIDAYSQRRLKVEKIKSGVVLPCKNIDGKKCAGVLNHKGEYVSLSAFEALSAVDSWGGGYKPEEKPEYIDKNVIYMGRFWKHWGHFITDLVTRLWYAVEIDKSTAIVYDGSVSMSGVYLEFLRLAGVEKSRLIRIEKPTKFANVIVPECSYKPGISCHKEYKDIFEVVANNALKEQSVGSKYEGEKLYFTRTGLNMRIPFEVGEKHIEKVFRDNGYLVISPEKYTLTEQIVMIRQAHEIACVAGTLPHNMMFAKDESRLVIIRKTNKPNYRQTDVNRIRRLRVTNIDAHISPFAVGPPGPFILDVNDNFISYAKDRGMEIKLSGWKSFWRRKGMLLWYLPLFIVRNWGKKREVPLYDGREFSTKPDAKKQLFKFYIRRI